MGWLAFGVIATAVLSSLQAPQTVDQSSATDADLLAARAHRHDLIVSFVSGFTARNTVDTMSIGQPVFDESGVASVVVTIGHCSDELEVNVWPSDNNAHFGTKNNNPFVIYAPNTKYQIEEEIIGSLPETPDNLVARYDNACFIGFN